MAKIDVLGTDYELVYKKESEEERFSANNAYGLSELYSKELLVEELVPDSKTFRNHEDFEEKVLRHEIFHALFHECGHKKYSDDEVLVDALAVLFPKIVKIIESAQTSLNEIRELRKNGGTKLGASEENADSEVKESCAEVYYDSFGTELKVGDKILVGDGNKNSLFEDPRIFVGYNDEEAFTYITKLNSDSDLTFVWTYAKKYTEGDN